MVDGLRVFDYGRSRRGKKKKNILISNLGYFVDVCLVRSQKRKRMMDPEYRQTLRHFKKV